MISYGRQTIDDSDVESIIDVLKSNYLTQGPAVTKFEDTLKERVGSQHAVAVNSGTSALHLACLVLDVSEGDCVWVPAISFVASANCARYCGASVDFIDIDPRTGNLDIEALKEKLEQSKIEDTLPKVLIVVHMAGNPLDMSEINQLASNYKFYIIEDASHALGAKYSCGEPVGSNKYSDITVFSFHPVKMITTGEGGMALTNNTGRANRMRTLSSHGIHRPEGGLPWYYQQTELGFNYRLSDIHAALGTSQLRRLDEFIERRKSISNYYNKNISADDVTLLPYGEHGESSFHLFQIHTSNQYALYQQLKAEGILCQVHYIPIPSQPYFQDLGFKMKFYPSAEFFYKSVLSLPIYPLIDNASIEKIVEVINDRSSR